MSITPPQRYGECQAGRMATQGRRTDHATLSTLVTAHQNDGSWTFHGLGAPT